MVDFRILFESAPGLYLVLSPDLTIVAASDAYLRATMTRRDAIVGRGVFEVFPDNPDDPANTGVRNLKASLERVRKNRVVDAMPLQKYDVRRAAAEGGGFEERFWSPMNYPVPGEDGELAYIIHRVEDVTEFVREKQRAAGAAPPAPNSAGVNRLEADVLQRSRDVAQAARDLKEAAEESENRYRQLFEASPLPMWVYDLETLAFLAVNEAAVRHYGYSVNEFLRMSLKDIRPEADVHELLEDTAHPPERSEPRAWRHKKKDGSEILVEISAHRLVLAGRRARLVLANDVTERRRLEDQLRQSQKMEAIGTLAGGVAHDFNNLLSVILAYSGFLQRDLPKDSPIREDLVEIERAGQRAAALTRQLLAFSRRQVLEPGTLDLNEIVSGLEKMLRRLIGEDLEMTTHAAPGLETVWADRGQIEQVLVNLVVNARDAMPRGGRLTIETANVDLDEAYALDHLGAKSGPHVMLAVSDTGHGMDKETLARIFEPFFTTKGPGKGTGLGLSTVFGIVKQSGGNIWVYSEPGKGTTFKVYLPRDERDPDGEYDETVRAQRPRTRAGTETILLVEDEAQLRTLVRKILAKEGYRVLEPPDALEAVKSCENHAGPIHLLITDVVMPKMSGREVAQSVLARRPGTRVLYMSGYTDDAVVHTGVLSAGAPFLQKPITAEALLSKVREVLDS